MKQELKSLQTKQLILDSAFKSIYQKGFKSINVNGVMKETGLSKGAFYHHFKNKEDLTVQTIEHQLHQRIQQHMIAPLYKEGKAVDILIDIFTTRLKHFTEEEKRLGCPLNNLINEANYEDHNIQNSLSKIIEEWKVSIVQLLKKGVENGELKSMVNPNHVATFIISAFEGARGIRKLQNDDEWLEAFTASIQIYLQGLKQVN